MNNTSDFLTFFFINCSIWRDPSVKEKNDPINTIQLQQLQNAHSLSPPSAPELNKQGRRGELCLRCSLRLNIGEFQFQHLQRRCLEMIMEIGSFTTCGPHFTLFLSRISLLCLSVNQIPLVPQYKLSASLLELPSQIYPVQSEIFLP